jgi:hypothetical protein
VQQPSRLRRCLSRRWRARAAAMTVAPRFLQSNASSKQRVFKATCLQSSVSSKRSTGGVFKATAQPNRVTRTQCSLFRAGRQARSASGSSTGEVPGRAKPIGKNVAAAPAPCSSQACAGHLSLISATLCPNPRKKQGSNLGSKLERFGPARAPSAAGKLCAPRRPFRVGLGLGQ